MTDRLQEIISLVEQKLTELHTYQIDRAKKAAHRIRANLTAEDLLNPDNFPEIIADPAFMYEDGQAAGIMSAKIALRQLLISLSTNSK